ncbi:MAG: hypothetical protein VB099_20530 [Candidatus Limiplasma sp.]|nr:hypothetical protein [Candidatus Limiplasma sp.]
MNILPQQGLEKTKKSAAPLSEQRPDKILKGMKDADHLHLVPAVQIKNLVLLVNNEPKICVEGEYSVQGLSALRHVGQLMDTGPQAPHRLARGFRVGKVIPDVIMDGNQVFPRLF